MSNRQFEKISLRKIRLNPQGCDSEGCYWGHDAPLWYVYNESNNETSHIRAANREIAKQKILKELPNAKFYR